MARPLRIDVPGGIAHVTARGNNRQSIFRAVEHRDRLVAILERVVVRHGWLCHAYVVMDNHYHLLLETPLPNLSLGMRQLNGLYAQWFNRRHDRGGHVFGGRLKSIAVEPDEHFLEAARYIVLNRSGRCGQGGSRTGAGRATRLRRDSCHVRPSSRSTAS